MHPGSKVFKAFNMLWIVCDDAETDRQHARRAPRGLMNATGKLQKDGLISYGSGRVTVLNRPKLEDLVCEC
jgi:hypothetical protein